METSNHQIIRQWLDDPGAERLTALFNEIQPGIVGSLQNLIADHHALEQQVEEQAAQLDAVKQQLQRTQDKLYTTIADQQQTEKALRESESQYRLLTENASDVVWRLDNDYRFTYVSPADERLRGYKADEVLGRQVFEVLNEEGVATIQKMAQQRLEKEQRGIHTDIITFEAEHRCKDGSWLWAEIRYSAERDAEGKTIGFHGITREITERKRAEDETRRARAAAEEASKAKSQFLATMSHEIRTPLNALVGFSTLARKATDPAKINQYLSILEQSSRSLMDLVNDILDISKTDAGRLELEATPINLRQLIASLEEQYHHLAQQKMLRFRVTVDDHLPGWVLGDPIRLRQILTNLLSNAVKFTASGEVSCSISRHNNSHGDLLRMEVQDSGIGIPKAFTPHLFHPFRQLDPSISRKFGGTGLGLAIVSSLVELMQGAITVNSTEGVGSCFIVDLPLQEAEPVATELVTAAVKLKSSAILVVEDNSFNRQLLGDILTSWGHQVSLTDDGHQALVRAQEQRFDLILLDIRMPGIDGIEVARRIRMKEEEGSTPRVPIIAITADMDKATRDACLAVGINTVLPKPVIPEQLSQAIALECEERIILTSDHQPGPQLTPQTLKGLNHNPERVRHYLEMLLNDIDHERQQLHTCLAQDDRPGLARAAHTLKSLYGSLENQPLVEWVTRIQNHALTAPLAELRKMIERLPTNQEPFN